MINRTLPLTDLHRHLDGNIRPSTIFSLAQQHGIALPADSVEALIPHVQVTENEPSLVAFLSKLDWGVNVLADLDACKRVAYENIQDLHHAKIDYAELRFSPYYMAMAHKLPLEGVIDAVNDGINAGIRDYNVSCKLIGIMSRTFGIEACQKELQAILSRRDYFVAADLAGDELSQPGEQFVGHFKSARDAGLRITVHAGEAAGAQSIWQAIKELGAERIGHGVKAVEDPTLLEYIATHDIGMESCLTSNIQTSTVGTLASHPIKAFLQHGIQVSLNTDDPAVEGIELEHEYTIAHKELGLSLEQCENLQRNGLKSAFLSDSERKALITKAQYR